MNPHPLEQPSNIVKGHVIGVSVDIGVQGGVYVGVPVCVSGALRETILCIL